MGTINSTLSANKGQRIIIPVRQNANVFKPLQLKFLYEEILLFCENDVTTKKYFRINSREVKEIKKRLKFEIIPIDQKITKTLTKTPMKNEFHIIKKANKSVIASLLDHIRNSFAHNRIMISNSGIVHLYDVKETWDKKKKNLIRNVTMYSKIESFSKLEKIIIELKKTQG